MTSLSKPGREISVSGEVFIANCARSLGTETDWGLEDAFEARRAVAGGAAPGSGAGQPVPATLDLREKWWPVRHQGRTGACVGFATADGLLRWLYVKKGLIDENDLGQRPSPRFIWMANKETDDYTRYPTTFLDRAGTSTKLALGVVQKFGCVPESLLPMDGTLSDKSPSVFFSIAARYRISAYFNLSGNFNDWRRWISEFGPILVRLRVDNKWIYAKKESAMLSGYEEAGSNGPGHAVCLVGYTPDYFIVRNSWGDRWGDNGFAYATNDYAEAVFTEAYGALMP